jgi:hypothetical protein
MQLTIWLKSTDPVVLVVRVGLWWVAFGAVEFVRSPTSILPRLPHHIDSTVLASLVLGIVMALQSLGYPLALKVVEMLKPRHLRGNARRMLALGASFILGPHRKLGAEINFKYDDQMPHLRSWYESTATKELEVLWLFNALVEIHEGHDPWPYLNIPTRCGGHTVFDHSKLLAEALLATVAKRPSAENERPVDNQSQQENSDWSDVADDPLIPILGISHGLGRYSVHEPMTDGHIEVLEVFSSRSDISVLRRIIEGYGLAQEDREILKYALQFSYGIQPHSPDRSRRERRLADLLRHGHRQMYFDFELPHAFHDSWLFESAPSIVQRSWDNWHMEQLCEILYKKDAINGPLASRIGLKHGDLLVLSLLPLARALASQYGNASLAKKEPDGSIEIVDHLLHTLCSVGALKMDWSGAMLKHDKAYFDVAWYLPSKSADIPVLTETRCVVLDGRFLPFWIRKMDDLRVVPRIMGPSNGSEISNASRRAPHQKNVLEELRGGGSRAGENRRISDAPIIKKPPGNNKVKVIRTTPGLPHGDQSILPLGDQWSPRRGYQSRRSRDRPSDK